MRPAPSAISSPRFFYRSAVPLSFCTFPVEQGGDAPAFKSELDLPSLSAPQSRALSHIKSGGGIFHRDTSGSWYPPAEQSEATRQTDRTIRGLIAKCWLTVTKTREGKPVAVRLTFP